MYRYRLSCCSRHVLPKARFHLHKLGLLISIIGYRYFGRYGTDHEAVLIRGTKGTARLSGVCWGYGGEGPHALRDLLLLLGVGREVADKTAFTTPRSDNHVGGPGEPRMVVDWKLSLNWGGRNSVRPPVEVVELTTHSDHTCSQCGETIPTGSVALAVEGHKLPATVAVQKYVHYYFCGKKCCSRGLEPEVFTVVPDSVEVHQRALAWVG